MNIEEYLASEIQSGATTSEMESRGGVGGSNNWHQNEGASSSYKLSIGPTREEGPESPEQQRESIVRWTSKQAESEQNQREVFLALKGACALPKARSMRSESVVYWENDKYCKHHKDSNHITMECNKGH